MILMRLLLFSLSLFHPFTPFTLFSPQFSPIWYSLSPNICLSQDHSRGSKLLEEESLNEEKKGSQEENDHLFPFCTKVSQMSLFFSSSLTLTLCHICLVKRKGERWTWRKRSSPESIHGSQVTFDYRVEREGKKKEGNNRLFFLKVHRLSIFPLEYLSSFLCIILSLNLSQFGSHFTAYQKIGKRIEE